MANGNPSGTRRPGALAAVDKSNARRFDADARRDDRESTPVKIEGVEFTRRRKEWATSRAMRLTMRDQEREVALANRVRVRVAELETEQIEAAAKGETDREAELEAQIGELVDRADAATEAAELVTYRLLALLLRPPADANLEGFGPVPDDDDRDQGDYAQAAVRWLQPALDVEDAADLARELTGSREPDPQTTPSSESGSS
jgi:hypothetical protein